MTETPLKPATYTLYRFFGANEELLYIGLTAAPWDRWRAHSRDKAWWTEVETVTVEHFEDFESLAAAERNAIGLERPRYNLALQTGASNEDREAAREAVRAAVVADRNARRALKEAIHAAVQVGVTERELTEVSGFARMTVRKFAGK